MMQSRLIYIFLEVWSSLAMLSRPMLKFAYSCKNDLHWHGTGFKADVKICQVTQVKLIRGSRSLLKKTCPVSGNLPFLFVIEGGTKGKSNLPSALATKEGGLGFAIGAIEHRSMHIMHYIIRDTLNVHSKYMWILMFVICVCYSRRKGCGDVMSTTMVQ